MTVGVVAAVVVIVGAAAFGQTVAGFGFSLLAVPPLGLVIDAKDAIAVSLVLLIANSAMLAWGERASIAWDAVGSLLRGAFFGLPLGLGLIAVAPIRGLRIALAIAVLSAVGVLLAGVEVTSRGRRVELVGGFFCGLLTTSLNTNGPPAVLALQSRRLPPERFRPTTSSVLGLTSLAGVGLFAVAGRLNADVGVACLVGLPAMLLGWQLGLRARPRVPAPQFRMLVLAILTISGLLTLFAAFR